MRGRSGGEGVEAGGSGRGFRDACEVEDRHASGLKARLHCV